MGGINASLGEMIQNLSSQDTSSQEVLIPSGFVITVDGYKEHLRKNNLEKEISKLLKTIDKKDLNSLTVAGKKIRNLISNGTMPDNLRSEIIDAYKSMGKKYYPDCDVAVRSSATAEDLPSASFAGQQETYLNVRGDQELLSACLNGMASLFTDRAISYRIDHSFDHDNVFISIGVQKMIRSDKASSGVIFTLDTESGHKDVILITSSYGLGENIVKGVVNPDEFYVHKPTLEKNFEPILKKRIGTKKTKLIYGENNDSSIEDSSIDDSSVIEAEVSEQDRKRYSITNKEILNLAKQALIIEKHYSKIKNKWSPMDIEWAKDGIDGKLYIVQARPETVHALKVEEQYFEEFTIQDKNKYINRILTTGKSVGRKIVTGKAVLISDLSQMSKIKKGEILVTDMTDPDWEPIMKIAGGIVTNRGGRTCHAAIVSRELGIPAIVGTTDGTEKIESNKIITLDCSSGETGVIYNGKIEFDIRKIKVETDKKRPVKILMNVGNPDEAFSFSKLPNDGVGLARLEFIINSTIQIHPMALVRPEKILDKKVLAKIDDLTHEYKNNKQEFFIDKLAQEAGTIAAAFYPKPVIIRLSDFKSNEYKKLIGGKYFEPEEENPMLGFRGASRYYHEKYSPAFKLECLAMKKIIENMGLTNIKLMIPFVRTVSEAEKVILEMEKHGLKREKNNLEIYMMCEIPSNVIIIDQFSKFFDGFSIGSNDLTQMTLGVDRDSDLVAHIFDERNDAVKKMIEIAINGAKENKKHIGICGQAPSDYPELTEFLIKNKIDSISLTPDAVLKQIDILD